jgi:hypothetical protein
MRRSLKGLRPEAADPREKVKLPKRSIKHAHDDQATLKGGKFAPGRY